MTCDLWHDLLSFRPSGGLKQNSFLHASNCCLIWTCILGSPPPPPSLTGHHLRSCRRFGMGVGLGSLFFLGWGVGLEVSSGAPSRK